MKLTVIFNGKAQSKSASTKKRPKHFILPAGIDRYQYFMMLAQMEKIMQQINEKDDEVED